jgi:FixJ family two-component response regulator
VVTNPSALPTARARRTVILIEGDRSLRASLEFLLSIDGYAVRSFATAEEFCHSQADNIEGVCLITAENLPGISGTTLLDWMHRDGNRIPGIVIHGTGGSLTESMIVGANAFLVKPIRGRTLLSLVASVIKRGETELQGCRH